MIRTFCRILALSIGLLVVARGWAAGADAAGLTATVPAAPPLAVSYAYTIGLEQSGSRINWPAGQLEVVGIGYIIGNTEPARKRARETAIFVARQEARRALHAIPLDAATTMAAALKRDETAALDDALTSLTVVNEKVDLRRGEYAVVGVLPLFSNPHFTPLASAAVFQPPLQLAKEQLTETIPLPKGHTPQQSDGPYTGIIINNDRALVKPCLYPRLLRFDGEEFWGPNDLTPAGAHLGPVRFSPNLDTALKAQLAGANPLIIEAVGNARGYYPLLGVDDVLFLHQLQHDEDLLEKLPMIFTLGEK